MVKTLGIKFEVAGVKEAQAGLNSLRSAVNNSFLENKRLAKENSRSSYRIKTNQAAYGASSGRGTENIIELGNQSISKLSNSIATEISSKYLYTKSASSLNSQINKPDKSIVSKLFGELVHPIEVIHAGFFQGIGQVFGEKFSTGLNKSFEEDLDISFERKGQVVGKGIAYTSSSGLKDFEQNSANVGQQFNQLGDALTQSFNPDEIKQKFQNLFKSVSKTFVGVGASYLTGFRKGSVEIEGMRKLQGQIAAQENFAPDLTGKKRVIYTVAGFAGDGGKRGEKIAEQVRPLVDQDTEVIGAENHFTDTKISAQEDVFKWGINAFANLAKINLKGFNPDAVKLAAQVVNTLSKNPDIVVDLIGHSAGGFVVEEAQELLNKLGLGHKVRSKTVGTPNVVGGLKAEGKTEFMGDKDIFATVEQILEYLGFGSPNEENTKGVKDHSFESYLNGDDFIETLLGKRNTQVAVQNPVEEAPEVNDDPWQETEEEVLRNRKSALVKEYKNYLEALSKKTKGERKIISQVIARDFAQANPDKQQELFVFMKQNFSAKAKAYRQAVKAGQLELANEQGKELIRLAASIKSLYGELAQFDELDPEVKNKFKSYSGYVSSVKNEVLSGSKAKGRATQGLPDIISGQMDTELNQDGEDITSGFIKGILADLDSAKKAGKKLVSEVDQGIREQGEIQSPSKLAARLGRWFAKGFGIGLKQENIEEEGRKLVDEATDGIKEQAASIDADAIVSLLDSGASGIFKKLGTVIYDFTKSGESEKLDNFLEIIGELGGKVFRLFITFKLLKVGLDALGLGKVISAFQNLPEEAIKSAIAVETLDNRILKMSGSASQGAKNLAFITAEAKRLNLNLTNAKENYSQVLKSTRDSSLEGLQTENIYTAFAATAKANGLDQTQEQELFRSVRSVIGKGVVSQEEVRQEIGEKLGDFQQSLAEAYGVSVPQLNKMIDSGLIQATEALPKVAAVLRAKNDIYGDLNTGAVAAQKADNAIVSFRESVGSALLPLQKFGNNFLAGFFNKISAGLNTIKPLINGFFLALLANLLRVEIFGQSVQKLLLGLIKLLWSFKGALGIFAAEMALIAAAWAAWENVGKMLKDRFFPEINKEIEQITNGMQAYRQAIDEASGAQSKLGSTKLKLNEGVDLSGLPEWAQNVAGGDRLNLDTLVRDRWNGLIDRMDAYNQAASGGTAIPLKGRLKTARENKEEQLKIENSNLSAKGNQSLIESQQAFTAASEITKYDAQIAAIQSARLKLLPGDQDALKASLEEEKKINQERDKQLKIVTAYQQTLTSAVSVYKSRLEDVEQRRLNGEISDETYTSERNNLQGLLTDTEGKLKAVNSELSKVSVKLSEFQRRLQKSDQRVEGYFAQYDRALQGQKAGIIEQGITDGAGTQVIQLELEEATKQDLTRRLGLVKQELAVLEKDLRSPELDAATKRIKENLGKDNIPLNESSLQDVIEKATAQGDKDAAQGLLSQLKKETSLSGLTEQIAQTLQTNRNAVIDLNRTINDYLFRITQQIQEAQIEVTRIVNQIVQTQIKNKLQAALSPNAESFANQLISSTQSLLDQAAGYAEKVLGQRGARIQFAGQKRTLELELQDFARNVSGASDALAEFERRLKGSGQAGANGGSPLQESGSNNSFATKTKDVANRLGIDPHALMTIMLFESAGTLDPKKQGPLVKNQGRGRGLIQFMPATARGLGTSDSALAAMTNVQQLDWVEKYFTQFKGNFGAGKLENLYAAVLAGDPKAVNASDGFTTARKGAKRMMGEYGDKASSILRASSSEQASGQPVSLLTKEGQTVAKSALNWQGKHFKEGVYAMCAGFVRQVLKDSGVELGVTNNPYDAGKQTNNGELMARSFFGSDIGKVFKDKNQAQPGDLVGFFDTYEYGQEPGAITHVGIYQGNDMMVDRSTSSQPVRNRSIDTFGKGNYIFVRPHAYSDPVVQQAEKETQFLIDKEEQKLDLQDSLINNQEKESLQINLKNAFAADRRKVDTEITNRQFEMDDSIYSQFDLLSQYDYQTPEIEAAKNINSVNKAFSDRNRDTLRQMQYYQDEINALKQVIDQTDGLAALAQTDEERQIIRENEANALLLLPAYEQNLAGVTAQQQELITASEQALYFVREQNKLKKEQAEIDNQLAVLNQKDALTQARGTIEQQRESKLLLEEARVNKAIADIRQNTPEGTQRNELILGELRQSKVNKENIDYDAQLGELDIERKLLDYQDQIGAKKAGFLSRFGLDFGAEKLKKENAIAQEKLRFGRELIDLEKQYKGDPEKLNRLTSAAKELNAVNLKEIKAQFKSLKETVEDSFASSAQGFFTNFTTNLFDGKAQSDRADLEERLRYAEERNQLQNQYSEEPGKLAHLKNRARELNEEKLDKIRGEFNLFSQVIDLTRGALLEFVKQLAQLAAQQAASKFISSVLNVFTNAATPKAAKVGNDYGSGAGTAAFIANQGITVGQYDSGGSITQRKLTPRVTSLLKDNYPGVAKAWNAEGEGAQLGVFHTGEELLSRKTGEAGLYQGLKRLYGANPLRQYMRLAHPSPKGLAGASKALLSRLRVDNYSGGGTIPDVGKSISSGFRTPRVNVPQLNSKSNFNTVASKTINIKTTVVTPNADSFRLNQDQLNQDLIQRMQRGV